MSSKLRQAREKAGYTVEEVARQLNIRKQYIIALEEEQFDHLPGKVYIDGYTKIYSSFLGVKEIPKASKDVIKPPTMPSNPIKRKLYKKYIIFISAVILIIITMVYSEVKLSKIDTIGHLLVRSQYTAG